MTRRLLTAAGTGMMVFGLAGLLRHADETMPWNWVIFFLGGLVAHDALVAPTAIAVGVALTRLVPRRFRPTIQGALLVSGALVAVAVPALTGNGRLGNNPTILPQDYGDGLLTSLGVVWTIAAILLVRAALRPPPPAPPVAPPLPTSEPGW